MYTIEEFLPELNTLPSIGKLSAEETAYMLLRRLGTLSSAYQPYQHYIAASSKSNIRRMLDKQVLDQRIPSRRLLYKSVYKKHLRKLLLEVLFWAYDCSSEVKIIKTNSIGARINKERCPRKLALKYIRSNRLGRRFVAIPWHVYGEVVYKHNFWSVAVPWMRAKFNSCGGPHV